MKFAYCVLSEATTCCPVDGFGASSGCDNFDLLDFSGPFDVVCSIVETAVSNTCFDSSRSDLRSTFGKRHLHSYIDTSIYLSIYLHICLKVSIGLCACLSVRLCLSQFLFV